MPRLYERELAGLTDYATSRPHEGPGDMPTGVADIVGPAAAVFKGEDRSVSKAFNEMPHIYGQVDAYYNLTGDPLFNRSNPGQARPVGEWRLMLEHRQDEIAELAKTNPKAGLRSLASIDEQIAADLAVQRAELEDITSRAGPWQTAIGMFAGAMVGAGQDPLNLLTMPLGAAQSAKILATALTEAGINLATEALITAGYTYDYRKQIGNPLTPGEAVQNVGAAGAFGFIFGGSFKALGNAIGAARPLTKRFHRREPSLASEVRKHVDSGELKLNAEEEEALSFLEDFEEVMAQNPRPEDGPAGEVAHIERMASAAESLETGKAAPATPADVIDAGADSTVRSYDPRDIAVDAKLFQFKGDGNAQGVNDRLAGVTVFDQDLAGVVVLWERADGQLFIADGHQRLALAKRAIEGGQENVRLDAKVWREVDGFDPVFVRTKAALINIAEGTGTALDAARVLRDAAASGLDVTLPPRSALVRDARALARLEEEAFLEVINAGRELEHAHAAHVGRLISDPGQQLAAVKILRKAQPANSQQAELMVQQVKSAGFTKEVETSLFGEEEITSSLFVERARVVDAALRRLKSDRSLFNTLVERENAIADAGNQLDREANEARRSTDEIALAHIGKLANSKGPIADAATAQAELVKKGKSVTKAADDFLAAVRGAKPKKGKGRAGGVSKTAKAALERWAKGDTPKARMPDKPELYFDITDDAELVPLSQLDTIRKRDRGVANAVRFMAEAALGRKDRRVPISVRLEENGRYTVLDGNSTVAIAKEQRFKKLPVRVMDDAQFKAESEAKAAKKAAKAGKADLADLAEVMVGPEVGKPLNMAGKSKAEINAAMDALTAEQMTLSLDELYARAVKAHKRLSRTAARLAKEHGIEWADPGPKARIKVEDGKTIDVLEDKIVRKGYDAPGRITDIARGAFVIRTLDEAETITQAIGGKVEILDEGWKVNASHWADRKLMVRDKQTGVVAEIQVREHHLHIAKQKQGGHQLYDEARALENDGEAPTDPAALAKYLRLQRKMRKLYDGAAAKADPSIRSLIDNEGSGPAKASHSAKSSRQSDSAMGTAESQTSKGDTGAQGEPSEGTAAAAKARPSESTASRAGRTSQDINSNDAIPADSMDFNEGLQSELDLAMRAELDDVLERAPDTEVPTGARDADGSPETKTAREVIDEAEQRQTSFEALLDCMEG